MSKAYCKWPVIIGIIIGSLIILSLVWCCARCICCGAECCCGCLACCNVCCPSPRGGRSGRNEGYQQAPPTPYHNQYHQPPPPMYTSGAAGYRSATVPQTATFDTPSKSANFNEDALPAMPSWDNATSRKVEQPYEDVEMEKFDQRGTSPNPGSQMLYQNPEPAYAGQQDNLLSRQETGRYSDGNSTHHVAASHSGGIGTMTAAAQPYHDYQQQRQLSPSPYESQSQNRGPASPSPYGSYDQSRGLTSPSAYSSQNEIRGPAAPSPYSPALRTPVSPHETTHTPHADSSANYFGGGQRGGGGYEASIPPSYHIAPPSDIVSPVSPQASYPGQQQYQAYGASNTGRQAAPGSWREV